MKYGALIEFYWTLMGFTWGTHNMNYWTNHEASLNEQRQEIGGGTQKLRIGGDDFAQDWSCLYYP